MPPDTDRGPTVAGKWVLLGGRKLAGGSCRDDGLAALGTLRALPGLDVFTVRDVYAEMVRAGTRYTVDGFQDDAANEGSAGPASVHPPGAGWPGRVQGGVGGRVNRRASPQRHRRRRGQGPSRFAVATSLRLTDPLLNRMV
jgi:hypothetical protein